MVEPAKLWWQKLGLPPKGLKQKKNYEGEGGAFIDASLIGSARFWWHCCMCCCLFLQTTTLLRKNVIVCRFRICATTCGRGIVIEKQKPFSTLLSFFREGWKKEGGRHVGIGQFVNNKQTLCSREVRWVSFCWVLFVCLPPPSKVMSSFSQSGVTLFLLL